MKKKYYSWGNYPKIDCKIFDLDEVYKLDSFDFKEEFIPYGNGRSYGDSALGKNLISIKKNNKFLYFDEKTGLLHVQSGVLLSEIISIFIKKKWFLKVSPGTKYVTVGGAIASDIHGKNHHLRGCFSESVCEFNILMPDGKVFNCSREHNSELFHATCGGMGLTGIILDVKMYLDKVPSSEIKEETVKADNLKELFSLFEKNKEREYSVAWIDCLASKSQLGKGILSLGSFIKNDKYFYNENVKIKVPFFFPYFFLNFFTIKLFNFFYFYKNFSKVKTKIINFNNFFYPLDSIKNWNKIYGSKGFTQYQFIIPKENSYEAIVKILTKINSSKQYPFLAVLKLYGKKNKNYLSFPIEGYSLAMDFKISKNLFKFLNELDEIVLQYNGRVYLTKDARLSSKNFRLF